MEQYRLDSDEVNLVTADVTSDEWGSGELILTNKNLILVSRTMWRNRIKRVRKEPLTAIKQWNDEIRAQLKESFGDASRLTVDFQSGTATFVINEKEKARQLVRGINRALLGVENTADITNTTVEAVAGAVAGTLSSVSKALGRLRTRVPPRVSQSCPGCGASVSGFKGTTIQCPQCSRKITLG